VSDCQAAVGTLGVMGSKRVAVALGCVAGGAAAAVAAAGSSTAVHATLTSAVHPRAQGTFAGSLAGRTLSWRLTFDGLEPPVTAALLRLGARATGERRVTLCAPCRGSWVAGRTPATASGLRGASVEVRSAAGSIRGPVVFGVVPTLQVGLSDGASLRLPATVAFVTSGFTGRVALLAAGRTYDLGAAARTPQVLTLPDDKRLTGRRDLTFMLVRLDGTRPANREARTTVYGVLLAGRR
jgi:hypothetical protein